MTYVKRQIIVQVSENQNGENAVIKRGDRETKFDEVAALNEASFSKLVIPIPTVDKDLLQGEEITTGKILYLETDTELTVKLALTSDTGFTVKPVVTADAATKRGVLYLEGTFTHVYVSVAGTTGNANVLFGVVGA
jgi:hypothetical protein